MAILLPIASGKGGVGKTVVAANLGIALAAAGKTVILVDLDLGGSNLHTCLGLKNPARGMGSLVWKQERHLSELLAETGRERLWFIAGDGLFPATSNLEWSTKRRILKELAALAADFVVMDLGAGSSHNVTDFFLSADAGLVVLRPEVTSVLNAYSFLKTAAYRALSSALSGSAECRSLLAAFASRRTEGSGTSFIAFARDLASRFPEAADPALERLLSLRPLGVLNQCRGRADLELGGRLASLAAKNLGFGLDFAAVLPEDEAVPRSVASRKAVILSEPGSAFARGVVAMVSRIASPGVARPGLEALYEEGSGAERA